MLIRLRAKLPKLLLPIAGSDGPERQPLLDLRVELVLTGWIAPRRNLPVAVDAALLQGVTLAVQHSRDEPFGLAVGEAAAYGIPVVASRVDGHGEIVSDCVTG